VTAPSVEYEIHLVSNEVLRIDSPAKLPPRFDFRNPGAMDEAGDIQPDGLLRTIMELVKQTPRGVRQPGLPRRKPGAVKLRSASI